MAVGEDVGWGNAALGTAPPHCGNPDKELRDDYQEEKCRAIEERLQVMPVHSAPRLARMIRPVGDKGKRPERKGEGKGVIEDDHAAIFLNARKGKETERKNAAERRLRGAPTDGQQKESASFYKPFTLAHISLKFLGTPRDF